MNSRPTIYIPPRLSSATAVPVLLLLLLLLLLAGWAPLAHAEKADRAKPMNIEADSMRYDDLKQTSIFTGKVVATKGTILVRGARIEVRQDAEGFQYGVVMAEPGKLAYYKQKRDNAVDEWIEGEGEVIEYNSKADDVRFIRRAVMRRLVGATVSDETSGPVIVYDQSKDVFTVAGTTVPPGASVTAGSGRVRALLTPRGAASAPAAAPAPGTGLRPSTTLGGDVRK